MDGYTDIIFQVKDEHVPRLVEALADHYGYREPGPEDPPNPETRAQFIRRHIRQEWVLRVKRYEHRVAAEELTTPPIDIQES